MAPLPDHQREGHGDEVVGLAEGRDGGDNEGGAGGLGEGSKQISAHAGDVANIVTNVVCTEV